MKEKTKNKLKKSSIMLFSFSCLALMGTTLAIDNQNNIKQENLVVEKVEQKEQLKKLPKRALNDTLTLPGDYTYTNWMNVIENIWNIDTTDTTNGTKYTSNTTDYIGNINNTYNFDQIKVQYYSSSTPPSNRYDIFFQNSQNPNSNYRIIQVNLKNQRIDYNYGTDTINLTTYPKNFYYTLTGEPEPTPEQPGMGEQIIDSVESGLGMIGTLATNFLAGFSALFWNATNAELTSFGIFSLVFLGIAITFSIIKLILHLIRSNTGV